MRWRKQGTIAAAAVAALLLLVLWPATGSAQPAGGGAPPSTPQPGAGGQQGPPTSPPAGANGGAAGANGGAAGAPSSQPPAAAGPTTTYDDPPQVRTDARLAAAVLARKLAILLALDAFGGPAPQRLTEALGSQTIVTTTDRQQLLEQLDAVQRDGQVASDALVRDGISLQPETTQLLGPLSTADVDALRNGQRLTGEPEIWLRALSSLLLRNGRPPSQPTPPEPSQIAAQLPAVLAVAPPIGALTSAGGQGGPPSTPAPSTPPSSRAAPPGASATPITEVASASGSSTALPVVLAIVIALLAVAGGLFALVRRRPAATPAQMDQLLEVSRRLTAATAGGEIERAIVREAIGLTGAAEGALVLRQGNELTIAFESQPTLLVAEHLADGLLGRVADTGQPVTQLSASEPALRNLPASLSAVPLVVRGSVHAVVVVVRDGSQPFTRDERELLVSLAPVTAAALDSASQANAAVEDSLLDPLTGAGNRRRLDAELPALLADADGRPTGFIMVDLDHFKAVNDTHGHPVGDQLLRGVVDVLREAVRPTDRVYRYGGEEFCVVLPDTDGDEAGVIAERIRAAIGQRLFDVGLEATLQATASLGVATTSEADAAALVARADHALYDAKSAGRDRVATAAPLG